MQEAISKQTDIKMTARKIRRVINLIRGKKATEAQRMLKFMPYFAARIVEKNLNAAIASSSVILSYLTLFIEFKYACSGPIPG